MSAAAKVIPAMGPAQRDRQVAIETYFANDVALFDSFMDSSRRQFTRDVATGDAAKSSGNGPQLQRLAHSLKSALRILGYPLLSALAAALEEEAAQGHPDAPKTWEGLRRGLVELSDPSTQ